MRNILILFFLLIPGCTPDYKLDTDVTFFGNEKQINIVKKELKKLTKENPVPYKIEVYCGTRDEGGYYIRGNKSDEVRVINISGSTEAELVRLTRHEYQHAVDEYLGVKTSVEREANAKHAEKISR